MAKLRAQAGCLRNELWLIADDGSGAASTGDASAGDVTSTTTYRPYFTGRAGEGGTQTTRTSDGDVSIQNCYTAPGNARNCNGK